MSGVCDNCGAYECICEQAAKNLASVIGLCPEVGCGRPITALHVDSSEGRCGYHTGAFQKRTKVKKPSSIAKKILQEFDYHNGATSAQVDAMMRIIEQLVGVWADEIAQAAHRDAIATIRNFEWNSAIRAAANVVCDSCRQGRPLVEATIPNNGGSLRIHWDQAENRLYTCWAGAVHRLHKA